MDTKQIANSSYSLPAPSRPRPGSYADLDGGSILWAFETLTGNYVFKFMLEANNAWKRYDLVHPTAKGQSCMLQPSKDQLNPNDMFVSRAGGSITRLNHRRYPV